MRKGLLYILLLLSAMYPVSGYGVRAYPHPKAVAQPDGTVITLLSQGDEFQHYVTTTDGYTVVKGFDGIYRYAIKEDGRLKASPVKASDINARSQEDIDYLFGIERNIKPNISGTGAKLRKLYNRTDTPKIRGNREMRKMGMGAAVPAAQYRGLVILVNFTDRKFSRGEAAHQLVDDMMNKQDYTYYDDPLLNGRISCTGSVRDYFNDNSGGKFIPEFDVVGPVEIDVDQYFINGTSKTYELCRKVLETADSSIDYTRYDYDGDGVVDMVYLLYAGYASVYQGNDERLVWPHAGHFADSGQNLVLDNMKFGRFACSSEIYGWHADGDVFLDGIGVIVHEFSHVLGLKDHYDVSGYLNEDPGTWDVMASGNYNGILNDTPCGYNSYEKYAAGFLTPHTLCDEDVEQTLCLRPLSSHDDAVRLCSTQDSIFFMLENRQYEKWDKDLPGHGMLIWRVDSCDSEAWKYNALNVNGKLHFKLIRAAGATRTLFQEIEDTDYDPFPGSRSVCSITNYGTQSNLLTDMNYPAPYTLRNIAEENSVISFTVEKDSDAANEPYLFCMRDKYSARGMTEDGTLCTWQVRTGVVVSGGRERTMIYNLVPDMENIAASNPKYADGLAAAYNISADKKKVYIEPYRVALTDDCGIWLVDFTALDNGGSGAIELNITPYGQISLANPNSVLGYCKLPKSNVLVIAENIIERFSIVKEVEFDSFSVIDLLPVDSGIHPDESVIYNLQGIPVQHPRKGELYISGGKKVIY